MIPLVGACLDEAAHIFKSTTAPASPASLLSCTSSGYGMLLQCHITGRDTLATVSRFLGTNELLHCYFTAAAFLSCVRPAPSRLHMSCTQHVLMLPSSNSLHLTHFHKTFNTVGERLRQKAMETDRARARFLEQLARTNKEIRRINQA